MEIIKIFKKQKKILYLIKLLSLFLKGLTATKDAFLLFKLNSVLI